MDHFVIAALMLCSMALAGRGSSAATTWSYAYATSYSEPDVSDNIAGACGYGNLHSRGYGGDTAALSTALFDKGLTCGACFQIRCVDDPQGCLPGSPAVVITATSFCPPDYALPAEDGGWCNPPRPHFEMAPLAFEKIAYWKAGIVPIQYTRVKCRRVGGVKFTINGSYSFFLVLVTNVGGDGDVVAVSVKGSLTGGWLAMSRNWGQNWQCSVNLIGQSLSFQITTSDGRRQTSYNVASPQWQFGQTFEGKQYQ